MICAGLRLNTLLRICVQALQGKMVPRKRTKHTPYKVLLRVCHKICKWRTIVLAFYILSSVLICNTIYCLFNPSNYPTKNFEDMIRLRSMENPPELPEPVEGALFSCVQFVEAPINSRQRFEVDLELLSEVKIEWTYEIRLTKNFTVTWIETKFLSYHKVIDFEVLLDGQSWSYYISEHEGDEYYTINSFNLTEKNEVRKLEANFRIERRTFITPFVKIPWLFNERYAQFINFPIHDIFVQTGNKSDLCILRVNLDLPFQQILIEQSGWMDAFVPPHAEWILTNPKYNTYEYMMFEYPIEQQHKKEGNTYIFETYFSGDNIANIIKVILVPDWKIPVLLLLFLSSPFYIPAFVLFNEKIKVKRNNAKSAHSLMRIIIMVFELYIGPITFFLTFLIGDMSPELFLYIIGVTCFGPVGLIFIFVYPTLFSLFYYKWRRPSSISF